MKTAKVNALIQQALERELDNAKMLDLQARDDVDLETEYSDFIRKRAKIERLKESGRYGTPAQRKQADQSNEEIISKSISGIMKGIIEGKNVSPAVKALKDFVGNINMSPQMKQQLARQYVNIERFQRKGYEGLQRVPAEDRKQLLELGKVIQEASGQRIPQGMLGIDQQPTSLQTPARTTRRNTFSAPTQVQLPKRSSGAYKQLLERARERIQQDRPLTEKQRIAWDLEQGKNFSQRTSQGQTNMFQHFQEGSSSNASKTSKDLDAILAAASNERPLPQGSTPGAWDPETGEYYDMPSRMEIEQGIGKRATRPVQRFTGFSPPYGMQQPDLEDPPSRAMTVEESGKPKKGKGLTGGKRIIYDTAMNVAKKVKGSTKNIHHQVAMELLHLLGKD